MLVLLKIRHLPIISKNEIVPAKNIANIAEGRCHIKHFENKYRQMFSYFGNEVHVCISHFFHSCIIQLNCLTINVAMKIYGLFYQWYKMQIPPNCVIFSK